MSGNESNKPRPARGGWKSFAEILTPLAGDLSSDELTSVSDLSVALAHAIAVAQRMPTTLNARARALIVTKLQESEHWMIELVREGSTRERDH